MRYLPLIIPYILGLSLGQVLFKKVGLEIASNSGRGYMTLIKSPVFYGACILYAILTIFWIFILSKLPLSVAYPFVLLSFLTTPLAGLYFFGETIGKMYWVGLGVMVIGGLIIMIDMGKANE
jgi:drug/metabolite transporter (DMT)-like permease